MKKISIGLLISGILIIGLGVVLSFLATDDKDKGNGKDKEKENIKVITLNEIDDYFKKSNLFNQYSNYFDITTKVEENKYTIEYKGKTIGIVAHRAPQLAIEVITKNISWDEAINNDWRKTKSWQPGWEYILEDK